MCLQDIFVEKSSSSLRNAAGEYLKDFFTMARENTVRKYIVEDILDWMAVQARHSDAQRRFGQSLL